MNPGGHGQGAGKVVPEPVRVADLVSDSGALRFRLRLLDREGRAGPPAATAGRILAAASLEYLDRRDGGHWPVVELGAVHLAPEAARALCAGLGDAIRGGSPGLAWRSGDPAALGLQAGVSEGTPGAWQVEVGLDLAGFLAGVAGTPPGPGSELALFRFPVARPALVAFASALEAELRELAVP